MRLTGPITHQWIELITETETVLRRISPTREETSSESYMTPSGETLPGTRRPIPLLSMKAATRIGTWNVRINQAGPRVEPARQKEGGKTSGNLEEVSRGGAQTNQHHLECGKKNSRKQSPLAQYSVRPLFHEEPNGLTTTTTS